MPRAVSREVRRFEDGLINAGVPDFCLYKRECEPGILEPEMSVMTVEEIAERVSKPLSTTPARRAILFGSYARGTADLRSDVDVLIIDDSELSYLDRIRYYFDMLWDALGKPIELLVYTESELETGRHRPFIERIIAEGKTLYER